MNNVTKSEWKATVYHFRRFLKELKRDILVSFKYYSYRSRKAAQADMDAFESKQVRKAFNIIEERIKEPKLINTQEHIHHDNKLLEALMNNQPLERITQ